MGQGGGLARSRRLGWNLGLGSWRAGRGRGILLDDLGGRLVLAQAPVAGLAELAFAGPALEFDGGDEVRPGPVDVAGLARRGSAPERGGGAGDGLEAPQEFTDLGGGIAG